MKKLLLLLAAGLIMGGCTKNNGYDSHGTIIGFDYRKCMCCSGWFIVIDSDTLRFQQVPEGSAVVLDVTSFPVDINLDWHYPDPQCMSDLIIVDKMELRK
jgi:hypothetical protein